MPARGKELYDTFLRSVWSVALCLFVFALIWRLFYLHQIAAHSPFFDTPVVDAQTYFQQARQLATEFTLGDEPFWQPPLYPAFLGALYLFVGENFHAYRLVQFALGALNAVLLFLIGQRLFSPGIGLAAGLVAALYGPLIYFEGELLPPVLAISLNLGLLLFLLRDGTLRQSWSCLVAGLLLGLCTLAVPSILPFVLGVAGWLVWRRDLGRLRARLGRALVLMAGALCIIGTATLRNHLVGDDLVFLSWNSGVNFYLGNNPDFPQTTMIRPGTDWYELLLRPKLEELEKPSAQSAYFWGKALSFIKDQPVAYLELLARKTGHFWQAGEIRRNTDIYFARRFSPLLENLVWHRWIAFPFGVLGPLSLVGLALVWKEKQVALIRLFILTYTGSVVLFFATARYRLPVVPLLILLACYAIFWLQTRVRERQWNAVLPAGIALLLLGWTLNAGAITHADPAQEQFQLGLAFARKGQVARSVIELDKALTLDPNHYDARFKLAELYLELDDDRRAEEHYLYLLKQAPERTSPRRNLGNIYLQDGRVTEALELFQQILELEPDAARSYFGLAGAHRVKGQLEEAETAYKKALQLEPDHFDARYNLAFLYEHTGRDKASEREYKQLLELRPDHADLRNNLGAIYLKRRDFADAASEFTRVLDQIAAHGRARRNLALAYEGMGRLPEAVSQYEYLIQNGTEEQVYNHLARLYRKSGDPERAAQARRQHRILLRGKEILEVVRGQAEQLFEQPFQNSH